MSNELVNNFNSDINNDNIPADLNNPFGTNIPALAQLAAQAFQEYIENVSKDWDYNFETQKGKMFGVLVVQKEDSNLGFLGAVSGSLASGNLDNRMAPSVFNENLNDPFISNGLTKIKSLGLRINKIEDQDEINSLKEERKALSNQLQKRLFEETRFLNTKGEQQNVLQIFEQGQYGYPPAAAGECAAPKLLQYALSYQLKPIAIAEFWWGTTPKSLERKHKAYYPACKEKCRPILEFMLDDVELFNNRGIIT